MSTTKKKQSLVVRPLRLTSTCVRSDADEGLEAEDAEGRVWYRFPPADDEEPTRPPCFACRRIVSRWRDCHYCGKRDIASQFDRDSDGPDVFLHDRPQCVKMVYPRP